MTNGPDNFDPNAFGDFLAETLDITAERTVNDHNWYEYDIDLTLSDQHFTKIRYCARNDDMRVDANGHIFSSVEMVTDMTSFDGEDTMVSTVKDSQTERLNTLENCLRNAGFNENEKKDPSGIGEVFGTCTIGNVAILFRGYEYMSIRFERQLQ